MRKRFFVEQAVDRSWVVVDRVSLKAAEVDSTLQVKLTMKAARLMAAHLNQAIILAAPDEVKLRLV